MGPLAAMFLTKFAEVLAAEAGQRISLAIAKKVTETLFGHLATKADLQRAVEEIKRHIDQKFDDLTVASIVVPFLDAKANFDIWVQNQDEAYLTYASQRVVTAISSFKESRGRSPAMGRQNFVALAGILALDVGIWFHKTALNQKNEAVLASRSLEHANLIEEVIGDIEQFEALHIVKEWEDSQQEFEIRDFLLKLEDTDGDWRVRWEFIGYVLLRSERRGDELLTTGYNSNPRDHSMKFEEIKNMAANRVRLEREAREQNIYAPARAAIKSLRASGMSTIQRHGIALQSKDVAG